MLKPTLLGVTLATVFSLTACNTTPSPNTSSDNDAADMSHLKMLTDVTWQQVIPVDKKPQQAANPYSPPNIHFSTQDRRFSGSDGCNRIMGAYEANGKQLKLGPIAGTRMACAPQTNDISRQFIEGLGKTMMYEIKGSELILQDQAGKAILTLQKADNQ